MGKAVISNRIYLDCPPEGNEKIVNALTYRLEKRIGKGNKRSIIIIKNYKILTGGVLSIPQGRLDLIPADYEIVDRRTLNSVPFPAPIHELREGQQVVYDETDDTCLINALVGWGKTFTALHIAKKLGQKTLVITHTTALRDQWIEEAESLFGMEIGKIGSGVYDIDHAIVVGNVQTVTKMVSKLAKEFGTIIIDECHHVTASTFTNIVDNLHARYRIGLSGTLTRTDGMHITFPDYFGHILHQPPQSHTMAPIVRVLKTGLMLPPDMEWAKKLNYLLYDEDYQKFIAEVAITRILKGHSVLIAASRVEFLKKVAGYIGESCVCITGETDFDERKILIEQIESGEKQAIAASIQIFSEGISVNILSSLIIAEPLSNLSRLEQLVGRIQRLHETKDDKRPEVIDVQFTGAAERKQANTRLGFYLNKGWEIVSI